MRPWRAAGYMHGYRVWRGDISALCWGGGGIEKVIWEDSTSKRCVRLL
jgi:hypothetical protein